MYPILKIKALIIRIFCCAIFLSCSIPKKINPDRGIVQQITRFYDIAGTPTFTHYLKIWHKENLAIEEILGVTTVTDTANITSVSYPVILYRFIDLKKRVLYDYKTFSDTAKIIHKAILPDSLMLDYGWSFYSERAPKIQGIPEQLSDTIIDEVYYKRAKFIYTWHDPKKNFLVGYFRCNGKGDKFSLEKEYSRKLNCTMVKYFDFKAGRVNPFASKEVNFISDTLTAKELKVFSAWEKNMFKYSIKK